MNPWSYGIGILTCLILLVACQQEERVTGSKSIKRNYDFDYTGPLFRSVDPSKSQIEFSNSINEDNTTNYFAYNYFYNGGGVSVGDVNNDGLPDLYFAGNQVPDRLYLNRGDLTFEDVSSSSGIQSNKDWSTGVSMHDFNQDGWLDIYVCKAGPYKEPLRRQNVLYLNQGDGRFKEAGEEFGLADRGYGTQAYYIDYDMDNDVDVYIVNHRHDFKNNSKIDSRIINDKSPYTSDQLYRNDGGHFTNVTGQAGLENKAWGLSASIVDFNGDGWPDIYVANDFLEPDFCYINQGDGTFRDEVQKHFKHISFYSMGSDVGDINNDGLDDLFVLDMVSEDHVRSKKNMASMSNDNFWSMVKAGYHHQYMSNMLHVNKGHGRFSEVASMAGIGKTDWSWAPLFADLDHDGYQDLFITNGIKRDVTDNDYRIKAKQVVQTRGSINATQAFELMTSQLIPNYAFKNMGDMGFRKAMDEWGLNTPSHSNGAMFADLDQDGDLDLLINEMDRKAAVYENMSRDNRSILVNLIGPKKNRSGVGAKVTIETDQDVISRTVQPSRGFMSGHVGPLHVGLGDRKVKRIHIHWSNGRVTSHLPSTEDWWEIRYDQSSINASYKSEEATRLKIDQLSTRHQENKYDDFIREILLPHRQSQLGPALAVGDVNGDGLDDVFYGSSNGHSSELLIQSQPAVFSKTALSAHASSKEDVDALFVDIDGDNDQDLIIAAGGNEHAVGHPFYQDELWINDGTGSFTKSKRYQPLSISSRCLAATDFDRDGKMELFIGGGSIPRSYPQAEPSMIYEFDEGEVEPVSNEWLASLGIVTAADWGDIDGDGDEDLVVAGEWSSVRWIENREGELQPPQPLTTTNGWYYVVACIDLDDDGKDEVLAGNIGWNNKFHPTEERPLHLYLADFDDNGQKDIVLSKDKGDYQLPVRGRECSSSQMPFILDKFPTYESFALAKLQEIYGDKLDEAQHWEAHDFSHQLIQLNEQNAVEIIALPAKVQVSPINSFVSLGDSRVLFTGNMYQAEVETIRYDAGIGGILSWSEEELSVSDGTDIGMYWDCDARKTAIVNTGDDKTIILTRCNDDMPIIYNTNHLR